jgi:hypothetical protein
MKYFILFIISNLLTGCISVEKINSDLKKVDIYWGNEISTSNEVTLHRDLDHSYDKTFSAVLKTFADLGLTVTKSSIESGLILTRDEAPKPLTQDEWEKVIDIENPKLKNITWLLQLPDEPKEQYVIISATIQKIAPNKTKLDIGYFLNVPKYDEIGLITPKNVAPTAVKFASRKIWDGIDKNLSKPQ